MQPFTTFTAIAVPLDRANVDTDQIIPKQYLKSIYRTGFGPHLFDEWRYLEEGSLGSSERSLNPEFILNQPRYQQAGILLAGDNFGCGSSREHAPWALREYGFRCLIAPSFADIFYHNCIKNGLLPIVLDEESMTGLMQWVISHEGAELTIHLPKQQVLRAETQIYSFEIDEFLKNCLINGWDEIALTLQETDKIKTYEQQRRQQMPWLFERW